MDQTLTKTAHNERAESPVGFMDILLYILAGSSMAIISISFLLWLRF